MSSATSNPSAISHPDTSDTPPQENDAVQTGPAIRRGVILFETMEGAYGVTDLFERGGSEEPCPLTPLQALIGAAQSAISLKSTEIALASMLRSQSRQAKPGELVSMDGKPISGK